MSDSNFETDYSIGGALGIIDELDIERLVKNPVLKELQSSVIPELETRFSEYLLPGIQDAVNDWAYIQSGKIFVDNKRGLDHLNCVLYNSSGSVRLIELNQTYITPVARVVLESISDLVTQPKYRAYTLAQIVNIPESLQHHERKLRYYQIYQMIVNKAERLPELELEGERGLVACATNVLNKLLLTIKSE